MPELWAVKTVKITDDVKTMVFEGACFDGTNIRLAAKRLGLRTDASGKFERDLTPIRRRQEAVNRACPACGRTGCRGSCRRIIDIYPEKERGQKNCL